MPPQPTNPNVTERTLMAVTIILLLLLSPMNEYWASLDAPWYSPYLVWAIVILLSWLLQRFVSKNEL